MADKPGAGGGKVLSEFPGGKEFVYWWGKCIHLAEEGGRRGEETTILARLKSSQDPEEGREWRLLTFMFRKNDTVMSVLKVEGRREGGGKGRRGSRENSREESTGGDLTCDRCRALSGSRACLRRRSAA